MSVWEITSGDDEASIFTLTKNKMPVDLSGATITAILVDYSTDVELVSQVQDEGNPNGDWGLGIVPIVFSKANTNNIPSTTSKVKLQIKTVKDNIQTSWWFDKIIFRIGF